MTEASCKCHCPQSAEFDAGRVASVAVQRDGLSGLLDVKRTAVSTLDNVLPHHVARVSDGCASYDDNHNKAAEDTSESNALCGPGQDVLLPLRDRYPKPNMTENNSVGMATHNEIHKEAWAIH